MLGVLHSGNLLRETTLVNLVFSGYQWKLSVELWAWYPNTAEIYCIFFFPVKWRFHAWMFPAINMHMYILAWLPHLSVDRVVVFLLGQHWSSIAYNYGSCETWYLESWDTDGCHMHFRYHELDLCLHGHRKQDNGNVIMTDCLSLDIVLYHVCINSWERERKGERNMYCLYLCDKDHCLESMLFPSVIPRKLVEICCRGMQAQFTTMYHRIPYPSNTEVASHLQHPYLVITCVSVCVYCQ